MFPSTEWLPTRYAVEAIGVSDDTLAKWRQLGLLKPGEHYRRKSPSPQSAILYHSQRCIDAMAAATARDPAALEQTA